MATNLRVNFIGKNELSKTTVVISKDLRNLQRNAKNAGNAINKSLGAVGLTLGITALANGLKNATKAASDDRKSQGLLANALRNTVGATSQAIAGAEQYIKKTQLQSAVLDDELRPALATAVRATGSLTKGQDLLDVALDVSAGTGKDLNTVTNAMSKALNGSTGSLKKLLPSIKEGEDWMGQLKSQFNGASEEAANLDPYKRLEAIFADLQETVGEALLPALDQFAQYLASDDGQRNVKKILDGFILIGKTLAGIIGFMIENINLVIGLGVQVLIVKTYFVALNIVIKLMEAGIIKATTAVKLMKYALISSGIGAAIALVGTLAATWLEATEAKEGYNSTDSGFDPINNTTPLGPGLGPNGETWLTQGYESFEAYMADVEAKKNKIIQAAKDLADQIRKALDAKIDGIRKTGEKFRDAVGIAFGVFGEDEYSVFNPQYLIEKMKRLLTAAKGFAANIAKLRKQGADEAFINEVVAMGPAQGNIVAKGLLEGTNLKDILGLRKGLYTSGAQVGSQQALATNATYEININKAVISASDIIREIKLLEKKSGRKYLVS